MTADDTNPGVAAATAKPKLLQLVRDAIRRKHYSPRTEDSYVHWIKRFVYFHGKRHPAELGEPAVTAFPNHLARDRNVAASTQNQALSALLFLYREALARPLDWLDGLDRAKRPARTPTVLTRADDMGAEPTSFFTAILSGMAWECGQFPFKVFALRPHIVISNAPRTTAVC